MLGFGLLLINAGFSRRPHEPENAQTMIATGAVFLAISAIMVLIVIIDSLRR
jgi:hypothetical protein